MSTDCVFCNFKDKRSVFESSLVFAIADIAPVTPGHMLIIPKQHRIDFFALTDEERAQSFQLIQKLKQHLQQTDPEITGFNIGMNCGEDAGQTVFHCHIHLIPRRKGDAKSPRGGVRGVIPAKQSY